MNEPNLTNRLEKLLLYSALVLVTAWCPWKCAEEKSGEYLSESNTSWFSYHQRIGVNCNGNI